MSGHSCFEDRHGSAIVKKDAHGLISLVWTLREPVLVSPELLEEMVAEINTARRAKVRYWICDDGYDSPLKDEPGEGFAPCESCHEVDREAYVEAVRTVALRRISDELRDVGEALA